MESNTIKQQIIRDDTIIINPGRTLDNTNAHEMVTVIMEAQQKGFKNVIMDFAELEFLSSAGVGSILGTVENSRDAGGDIILCNLRETILHVLNVLDLHEYLTIKKTRQEAAVACGISE